MKWAKSQACPPTQIDGGITKMEPSEYKKEVEYIKGIETDEAIPQDLRNVTQIDEGILHYVRQRMGCERVTREVVRQAIAFEREMSRMSGW